MNRIFLFLSLCALLCQSCETKKVEQEKETAFLVSSPLVKDTLITREYVSQIRAVSHIEVRALERGYLQNIYVDEGQAVKKGQLMFQIKPAMYQAELRKAQAEAEFAQIEYRNTKNLADHKIVAVNELAMARAKLDKAQAEVSLAQVHLGFTQIRAPFDGIMDHLEARVGSLLDEGDLLTTLSDNSEMWVYFNVPEAEYLDYKSNQSGHNMSGVRLQMANHKLFTHQGNVKTIEADFNNETGNIAFRATFPNPERLLRHGATGIVLMDVPIEQALLIPQKATFEVMDKKYVYVVDKNGRLKSREILIAAELPHIYVVKDGLGKNDKILLEGLRLVKENEKIHYKYLKPASVMSQLDLYAE
jgi:membrane fusion protein (multidrug efflux system)